MSDQIGWMAAGLDMMSSVWREEGGVDRAASKSSAWLDGSAAAYRRCT